MSSDQHTLRRFGGVLLRVPRYALLAANLARDGRLSRKQRLGALACMGYVLSPIDLVPGVIPVLGQLDDLTVLIGGLKLVLRTVPPGLGIEQLRRAGLTARDVDSDLATVGETVAWLVQQSATQVGRLLSPARLFRGRGSDARTMLASSDPSAVKGSELRQALWADAAGELPGDLG